MLRSEQKLLTEANLRFFFLAIVLSNISAQPEATVKT